MLNEWQTMLKELRKDQQQRWQSGDHVSVDVYLLSYPELARDSAALSDLILGEITLREALGQKAPLDDYLQRYPQCAETLGVLYRSNLMTAMPEDTASPDANRETLAAPLAPSSAPLPSMMETMQLDEAGQLAAQQWAAEQGMPKIPGYRVIAELGRGGMGIVYRARQLSANRDVALKLVRGDVLDTLSPDTRRRTLERFRTEAQAAAGLEHQNLVPVYDVGEAGSHCYYAMRFVDGTSLYDMLRNKALSNREAARYIEPVARGLHFAHEHGVLHRDLKPHNIIVERKTGRPMLTDFGLAKFMEQRDELTHAGDVMGTPSYMSPEQARDSGKVTALADVYSVGATLYHLLTSRPPFQASNVAETIRQVLDEEPMSPRKLNPAIDRDLETICLKCLRKEPARRYESALALADDLQRFLNHETILARPAGLPERVWRWCRRNPRLAGAFGTASLLLVFWLTTWISAYFSAVAAVHRAHFLIDDMTTVISEDELLNEPGMQELRQKLLDKALVHYQELLNESGGNQSLQDDVARAHFRVGAIRVELEEYDEANANLEAARSQQEKLLRAQPTNVKRLEALSDTLSSLGKLLTNTEKLKEAGEVYAMVDELRLQLTQQAPDDQKWQRKLASARANLGLVELNRAAAERNPELEQAGRNHIREAQEKRLAVLEKHPDFKAARRDLAMGYYNLANFDSLAYFNSPEPLPTEKATLAIQNLQEAVKQFELLGAKEGESLSNRSDFSNANALLSGLLAETGDIDAALAANQAAIDLMTSLAVGNPKVDFYQKELAMLVINQGHLHQDQKDYVAAHQNYSQAQRILEKLIRRNPENINHQAALGGTLGSLGHVQLVTGDVAAARQTLVRAVECLQTVFNGSPDDKMVQMVTGLLSDTQQDLKLAQEALGESPAVPEQK